MSRYDLCQQINQQVNTYPYSSDQATWKQNDYWERIGLRGTGDCEDYVLEKRKRLMDAGIPPEDLRIGTVIHPTAGPHAVLVIRDGDHDWVADQTQPNLMTADQMKGLGYQAQTLQVPNSSLWEEWKL